MDQRTFPQFNKTISRLGFGGMRFPKNPDGTPDRDAAVALLQHAYESGVNYFDTAAPYHKGESEPIFRQALSGYPRDSYYVADKMSMWMVETEEEMKAFFYNQLEKLGVDYIDFYLLHSMSRTNWEKALRLGAVPFLEEMKAQGKIRHLGFSFHDTLPILRQILDYRQWDFAQLQLNYLDWENQHADQLYQELVDRKIPCIVMEPVRGGYLANLDPVRAQPFTQLHPDWSLASWAIRWVSSLPNVMVVLSGMSAADQLEDNLHTLSGFTPLTEAEQQAVSQVVSEIRKVNDIPCTGCRYCMDCPSGVDIPGVFTIYSEYRVFDDPKGFVESYQGAINKGYSADHCVRCGKCATHCPQQISIPQQLARIHQLFLEEKAKLEAAQ